MSWWMVWDQKKNSEVSFLPLLFLLKCQQPACCHSLEDRLKPCISASDMCGRWCFGLRQKEDFICQLLTLTMVATADAHVSSCLIRSWYSGAFAASLSRGGTKESQSGICLKTNKQTNKKHQWGYCAHLASSKQSRLSQKREALLYCSLGFLSCSLSFRKIPTSLHTE